MRLFFYFTFYFLTSWFSEAQTNNYYFGNLHAHTAFSDGNKDSLVSGIARPDAAYNYAKLSNEFDFLGISEHNHYSSNHNPGFKRPLYQTGINMANTANQDGSFLALFGMEYGVSSQYNGHVLIYGMNQLIGWESFAPDVVGNNYDVYNAKTDYDALFRKIKNDTNAFCYLAHPDFSDFTTDGTYATSLANAPYNAAYDSAIVGMPLRSGLATSAATNYNDYSLGNYFNYFKKMLYQGYHLGIGYDHDNHYSNFGRSNGGRLVLMAPSLTRANLFKAMKGMNFYGSDDSNAKISFELNGQIMGSIVSGSVYPTITIQHNDPDGEKADTIKIWKGYKNSGGLWAEIINVSLESNTSILTDKKVRSGIEYYYFAEIRQADGQWIMTSPIWFKALAPLSAKETINELTLNYFSNPVSKNLSLSLNENDTYKLTLTSISGNRVLNVSFYGRDYTTDLSEIISGIYVLRIESEKNTISKKLVID